jgi:hypothetical protein
LDFNALAMSLAQGMADVRGCLILSRDGLVLGAHPAESERAATRAWVRFATIGDPERGFVQFGTGTWCYVRRAPYAGFALAGPGERAGLVIDHMEQVLVAAEESRSRREGRSGTEAATVALRSEPASYLDLERPTPDPLVIDVHAPVDAPSSSGDPPEPPRGPPPRSRRGSTDPSGTTRRPPNGRPTRSPTSKAARTSRLPARPGSRRRPSRFPTRNAGPAASHAPTRNRSSSPRTRGTRGRERARRRAPAPGPSPRTAPRRSATTSTGSRSRGSSAACFRGTRTLPMVRRPGDRRA